MHVFANSIKIASSKNSEKWANCLCENNLCIFLELESKSHDSDPSQTGKSIMSMLLDEKDKTRKTSVDTVMNFLEIASKNIEVKTAVIAALDDNNLYIASKGDALVYLVRGERIGCILEGEKMSEGQVKQGDILIFLGKTLDRLLKEEKNKKVILQKMPQDIEEVFAPQIVNNPDYSGHGFMTAAVAFHKDSLTQPKIIGKLTKIGLIENFVKASPFFKSLYSSGRNFFRQYHRSRRNKIIIPAIGVLTVFLLVNIFLSLQRTNNKEFAKKIEDTLSVISQEYEEASSLIDLNPVRSRELLSSAKISISELLGKTKKNSKEYKLISDWLGKISEKESEAYRMYKLTAVPLFFDINFIKEDGQVDNICAYKEKKVILDRKNSTLYYLATDTKQSQILAGIDEVKDAKSAAIHADNAYILNQDGIKSINIETKEVKTVIGRDAQWGDIVSIAAYAANLYLLDKTNNTVYKYIATDDGFSDRRSYLNPGVQTDFSDADKLVIDGSVWVSGNGQLYKFNSGAVEQFRVSGISDTIASYDSVSTDEDAKFIYILDKMLSRIIVLDKDGVYQSQYQWDELKDATDIIVSESEGKIFVGIGSKIYAIDLK